MASKQKKKQTKMRRRSTSPPRSKIRRNAAPAEASTALTVRNAPPVRKTTPVRNASSVRRSSGNADRERIAFGDRVRGMNMGHVVAGIGAAGAGTVLSLVAAGEGWVNPKATSWTLVGTGALGALAGFFWESDTLMATGFGLGTAGTCSLVTQYGVDGYEAIEERAEEKRAEREQKEHEKQLSAARAMLEAESQKAQGTPSQEQKPHARNARRIVIIPGNSDKAAA